MLDKVNIEPILQGLGLRERASQGRKTACEVLLQLL